MKKIILILLCTLFMGSSQLYAQNGLTPQASDKPDTIYLTVPADLPLNWEKEWKVASIGTFRMPDGTVKVTTHYERRIPLYRQAYNLYLAGGYGWMSLITLCLVAIFLAAWKMPSHVKEFGQIAVVIGVLSFIVGMHAASGVIQQAGDVSPSLISGGIKVALIAPIWGCIVYLVSLIVRLIQKPKTI